jgi:hypothetical protein
MLVRKEVQILCANKVGACTVPHTPALSELARLGVRGFCIFCFFVCFPFSDFFYLFFFLFCFFFLVIIKKCQNFKNVQISKKLFKFEILKVFINLKCSQI